LEEASPYRYTLLSASVLLCACIPLFAATGLSVKGHRQRRIADGGKSPLALIVTLSLIRMLVIVGEGLGRTFFNVYLDTDLSVPTSRIGALSALAQLAALLATTAMPFLVARVGKAKTVLLGNGAMALCLLPMALIPHWVAAGGGFIGMVMVMSLSRPAFVAFHQESVEPRWRTAMSGAITMVFGLGSAIAAFGGGYLVAATGYRGLFLTGAAVSFAGMLMFWVYFIAPRQRVPEETPQASSRRAV
jgi:predicted MFS family arabinose efflux permease